MRLNVGAVQTADRGQLVTFAARVAENARSLLSDAELLLEHERWPRAYALAVLSCEEFGKACGLMLLSLIPDNMRSRAQPDKLLGHHQSKMLGALIMRSLEFNQPGVGSRVAAMPDLAGLVRDVELDASDANDRKQVGLYADVNDDMTTRLPSDVTEAEARAEVARALEVATSAGPLSHQESLARLADPPLWVLELTPLLIDSLNAVPVGTGPDEIAAAAVAFVQALSVAAAGHLE